jgi:hypothetical protein
MVVIKVALTEEAVAVATADLPVTKTSKLICL